MSSKQVQERISELLRAANESADGGDLQEAAEALKEASSLDRENTQVRNAIVALQRREATGDALNLIKNYLGRDRPRSDGEKALKALKQRQLPKDEAEAALDLLLNASKSLDLIDDLTGTLIHRSIDVKQILASKFREPVTTLFDQFYELGPDSFKGFATLPFDDTLWSSKEDQARAQRDNFRLCIAKLIDVDIDNPERLMQIVARQLAIAPDNLGKVLDADVFAVILNSLDIRLPVALRRQAMLATSKALEASSETGEQIFGQYLVSKVAQQTIDDLIVAFSAASAVFPMIPVVAARLFLTDGFVQQLVPNLERNSEFGSSSEG